MSLGIPNKDETPISKCQALYLGTSILTRTKQIEESNLSLDLLQDAISDRYPTDGNNYAKGKIN
jgi:hypothetical protein